MPVELCLQNYFPVSIYATLNGHLWKEHTKSYRLIAESLRFLTRERFYIFKKKVKFGHFKHLIMS